MDKQISAAQAKNNFGTLLDEVYAKGNTVTILRNNRPVAKVVPLDPTETQSFEDHTRAHILNDKKASPLVRKIIKEARDSNVIMAEIDEESQKRRKAVVKSMREKAQRYGDWNSTEIVMKLRDREYNPL